MYNKEHGEYGYSIIRQECKFARIQLHSVLTWHEHQGKVLSTASQPVFSTKLLHIVLPLKKEKTKAQ